MQTLKIFAHGLVCVCALVGYVVLHYWDAEETRQRDSAIIEELTPEKLIASCGEPVSDNLTFNFLGAPEGRVIRYGAAGVPVKFTFVAVRQNGWELRFFSSPSFGARADVENAYIAVSRFKCLRPKENILWRRLKERLLPSFGDD